MKAMFFALLAVASCCPAGGSGSSSGTGCTSGSGTSSSGAGGTTGTGSTTGTSSGSGGTCLCDCPNGPPPPPQADTFCASVENDGKVCCRKVDGSETGHCRNHECVQ